MSDYIASLLDSRRPGFALPGAFFSDERVFAADLEHIFARHWLFVASEPEIPEAGDYRTYQVGPYPIFILRQDDGSIAKAPLAIRISTFLEKPIMVSHLALGADALQVPQ